MPSVSDADQLDRNRSVAKDLLQRKDEMEAELKGLHEALRAHGVGMSESLVDNEGFPRVDLEIHQIRILRNAIARSTTDIKQIMSDLEKAIHDLHSEAKITSAINTQDGAGRTLRATADNNTHITSQTEVTVSDMSALEPFLSVTSVAESSPADAAGLMKGDEILKMGSANAQNFRSLQDISDLINNRENRGVDIAVLRNDERLQLYLTPKKWSGRGLLGCHIVPKSL
ncbi:hypothetical protein SARC_07786 [Sphaeroforma arctica JP610]|uniref:PDZ domain-containing protein n=1 Tax=Sphaeroforma arctica JP610 TaxID=667725 RepID=A0A0L0FV73_9EUKA|nr:hypothetical protein SARC_07786 [Sphaeroforma arctica JP610]KNC79838.1 hypothetical protein SARC_07786 [Sphaeroforma arctica JP610]|eukprot:XP_014153740.1 hypothetical protein SARC_07786 [Sphaeroforma arctica JP610]